MRPSAALAAILLLAACTSTANPTPASSSGPSATPGTPAPTAALTPTPAEPVEGLGGFVCQFPYAVDGSVGRAQITDVRGAAHAGFDRIVFQFAGGPPAAIPEFEIRVGTPPFTLDPSGLPLSVSGSDFLVIVLRGGTMVDESGQPTYSGPTDFTPGLPVLQELANAGDFEALSTWIAGLTGPACVRATALANPSRLVIDLEAQ